MTGLAHHTGNVRHELAVRGNDLYQTPREAVLSLLAIEPVPRRVWEPACGPGAIVRELRTAGFDVMATDLVNYSSVHQDAAGVDFLIPGLAESFGFDGRAIITNPPFKNAPDFVRRALDLSSYVAMLLPLGFIRGTTRCDILDPGSGLARMHVFSRRLPMMHREGWGGKKADPSMDFAWYVWVRGFCGAPSISRVDWERHA